MDRCFWTIHEGERIRIPGCWGAVLHYEDEDYGEKWCTCYDTTRKKRRISQVKKLKITIKKLKKQLQKCKQQ
jgi:hypothetical protein